MVKLMEELKGCWEDQKSPVTPTQSSQFRFLLFPFSVSHMQSFAQEVFGETNDL